METTLSTLQARIARQRQADTMRARGIVPGPRTPEAVVAQMRAEALSLRHGEAEWVADIVERR
jgi:hypothetical protein